MIIGVDIGGTFTDVVCVDPKSGEIFFTKVPTNYADIVAGVLEGVSKMLAEVGAEAADISRIAHGTTIATNVVVQRAGARMALMTTRGFEDVLEIGRLKRRDMYDLNIDVQTPVFLCPRRYRIGIPERLDPTGKVLEPLDEASVAEAIDRLVSEHAIEAVTVAYLYAFRNDSHEQQTRDIIRQRQPGIFVSLSSEVNPIYREYERTAVTAFDAYMRPVVERFMGTLEKRLRDFGLTAEIHVMQSRGGVTSTRLAGQRPVHLFLSGPAGGVVGAARLAHAVGEPDVVTVDIGGTSCDVALIADGRPAVNATGNIAGYPLPISMVGVNTIGAGGGSVLWLDGGGSLRVGPRSAGSMPGPVCYDRGGEEPTVTDASLALGYLNPRWFAAGEVQLNPSAADAALAKLGARLNMSASEVALGAQRIINVQMAEQIRLITIRRGHDPRKFTLMAFGGAGPLHAGALISMLGMKAALIPQTPGVLSAFGLLVADVEVEQQSSFLKRVSEADPAALGTALMELEDKCLAVMRADGFATDGARTRFSADMRYIGQSYEIVVSIADGAVTAATLETVVRDFEAEYVRLYGFSNRNDVEIVNLRAVAYIPVESLDDYHLHQTGDGKDARDGETEARFLGAELPLPTAIYRRDRLRPGDVVEGPAIVQQPDTTVLVYPRQTARVDPHYSLFIEGVSEAYSQ